MPRYSAQQIYAFARSAGFSPDQSATMTAIALAESRGDSRAHNPRGEDSRGLWQINARAHHDLAARYDLYDPKKNALAAYEVSRHGHDVSPWTTTHGGSSARYVRFRAEAQEAATAYGDGAGRGVWTGTSAYGHALSAGPDGPGAGLHPVDPVGATGDPSGGGDGTFVRAALAQRGDSYVFGAEVDLADPDPSVFDCSELTQWAAAQAHVTIPDGASAQYLWAKDHGYLVPVSEADRTPGALLFYFSSEPTPGGGRPAEAHVAISLGADKTIEARGHAYGVNEFSSPGRFTYAAVIPGLASGDVNVDSLLTSGDVDTDQDGLSDDVERHRGLDPSSADTDHDTLPDGYELNTSHTDPRLADTDNDRLSDAFELSHGLDPTKPDTGPAVLDAAFSAAPGSDGTPDPDLDGLDTELEQMLGLNPNLADTDADGFSDGLEYHSGSNPLSAFSTPLHPDSDPAHATLSDHGIDDVVDDL